MYVVCLDSTGKLSTCDSFYVRVVANGTNAVLFSDSGTLSMTGMDSISGKSEYYFHRATADIDGGGTDGEYTLWVIAKKTAGSGWPTPNTRIFEIANNLVHDSLILKRLGVYNTTASTTTNDYGAVEFSTTGDSSFAFVVKNTGIAGAKFKGSAFKLYSKTHSGILAIGGSTGSPTSGGVYFLDSSANGYGQYTRSTAVGYGALFTEDAGGKVTTVGPMGGDIVDDWITPNSIYPNAIGASELADDAAREIASHILKDTTKRIGVKGGLGDSVLTPTPSVSASVTSLPDSVQSNIARHVWDRTADTTYPNKSWGDTVGKTALNVVTYLGSAPLKPSDTDELRANIAAASATSVWASGTRILTAGTNIVLAKGTGVTGFNDITAADVWAAATRTLTAVPTGGALEASVTKVRDSLTILASDARLKKIDSISNLIALCQVIKAAVDTSIAAAGWKSTSSSTQGFSTDTDTLHIWWGPTELLKTLFWHVGKGPGSVEIDSTRVYWLP